MSKATSNRPGGPRYGLKSLITVGAMATTALGWILFGNSGGANAGSAAPQGELPPPGWADLLAPLPTLVPATAGIARQPAGPLPVLRSVILPAPRPIAITRSSM